MATMKKAQNGTREKVSTVSNLKPAKAIPFNHNNQFSRKTLNSPLPSSASILRKKASAKNGKTLKKGGTVKKAFLGNVLGAATGLLGGGKGGILGGLLGGGGGSGSGGASGGMGNISKMFGGSMKKGGKVAKKAKTGTSLGMKSIKAGFDKNPGVTRADIITAATKKAQNGVNKKPKLLTVSRTRQVADSLDNVASQKVQASINRTIGAYGQKGKGFDRIAQELNKSAGKDSDNATRYRKLADAASKKKKAKTGASVKKCRYGCK